MSTKLIGDFGEQITSFCLSKKYAKQGLLSINASSANLPYDLLIPMPYDKTPFTRPTAINVKTRGTWSDVIPPKRSKLIQIMTQLDNLGFDYWIGFVKYSFKDDRLSFEIYLLPANQLSEDSDFREVTRSDGKQKQILTKALKQKAWLRFFSA